jgi:hypothetical protein
MAFGAPGGLLPSSGVPRAHERRGRHRDDWCWWVACGVPGSHGPLRGSMSILVSLRSGPGILGWDGAVSGRVAAAVRSERVGWVGGRWGGRVGRVCRVSRTLLQGRGAGKLLLTSRQVREKMVRG